MFYAKVVNKHCEWLYCSLVTLRLDVVRLVADYKAFMEEMRQVCSNNSYYYYNGTSV